MSDDLRARLVADTAHAARRTRIGTLMWSTLYNGGTLVSLACSVAATLLLSLKPTLGGGLTVANVTPWLSALAALAVGVPKYISAERKWRINRWARTELRILDRDLADPATSLTEARERLGDIERRVDDGVLGSDDGHAGPTGKRTK